MDAVTISAETLVDRGTQPPGIKRAPLAFVGALFFVGAVSVYDGYLVLRTGDEICRFEKNPVGLWLIVCNHGDPTLFLIAKGAGTSVVLASLIALYRRSQRIAFPVAYALLFFQSGLLIFLARAW
jgi:hypothetical protein